MRSFIVWILSSSCSKYWLLLYISWCLIPLIFQWHWNTTGPHSMLSAHAECMSKYHKEHLSPGFSIIFAHGLQRAIDISKIRFRGATQPLHSPYFSQLTVHLITFWGTNRFCFIIQEAGPTPRTTLRVLRMKIIIVAVSMVNVITSHSQCSNHIICKNA